MQIECPDCHRIVSVADVNLDRALARCLSCNSVFGIAHLFPNLEKPKPVAKPVVDIPAGISVLKRGNELHITQTWFNLGIIPLGIFGLVWNGFLIFWYGAAIRKGDVLMMAFPILHVAVGLVILYACLSMLLNKTRIRVGATGFDVRHGPLPVPGINRVIPGRIEHVYCKEKTHRTKNGSHVTYDVYALLEGGQEERIVRGFHKREQALFIEQAFERHLGIEDRLVEGESEG